MSKIVVPTLERDESNSDEVRLAVSAVLLGENAVVDRVKVQIRYRLRNGEVRFLQFGDEDVTS